MINIISSYIIQFCIMLTPFIVIPLISRGLIKEEFEYFLVIQSISIWVSMLIEYGFNITAPKIISREEKGVSSILFSKLILSSIAFSVNVIVLKVIGISNVNTLLASLYVVLLGVNTYWYFLSRNDLKSNSKYEIISSITTIFTFWFLINQDWLTLTTCLVTLCFGRSISLLFSAWIITKNEKLVMPKIEDIKSTLIESSNAFLFRVGGSLYTVANGLILTFALNVGSASQYLQAERLVKALFMGFIIPLNNGLYTKILAGNIKEGRYLIFVFVFSIIISLSLYTFKSEAIYYFYGTSSDDLERYLSIFILIIPIISTINTFNFLYIFPNGLEHYSSIFMIVFGLINVIVAFPIIDNFNIQGFILLNIMIEILVLFAMFMTFKAKR
ncbi:oligosaccharide flippase family protein [Vibrio campbellii]|uniref:oligosaccharide flippase family protein n=1 Tax=Vibrio campbellii TaxID=680 RepID=UPI003CE4D20D